MTTADLALPRSAETRLLQARGFVLDMDGTLVLGDSRNHGLAPLPGALELTAWLDARAVPFVVSTNGTTRAPAVYAQVLRELGFPVADEAMLTPVSSALEVFRRRGHHRVVVLGEGGIHGPLAAAGLEPLAPQGRPEADAVLVGFYPQFTMAALESACHAVWAGARLYSCSPSIFFASAAGRTLGTSRAITAMIRSVTGCRSEVVGKPSLHALRTAARRLGVPARSLAVVGDDPDLEIVMAHRGGALAVGVTTGIAGPDGFAALPAPRRPHLVLPGVGDLVGVLGRGQG